MMQFFFVFFIPNSCEVRFSPHSETERPFNPYGFAPEVSNIRGHAGSPPLPRFPPKRPAARGSNAFRPEGRGSEPLPPSIAGDALTKKNTNRVPTKVDE